jgi:hypothetical protein
MGEPDIVQVRLGKEPVKQAEVDVELRTKVVFMSIVLTLMSLLSACSAVPSEMGILQGHVSVGPLVPVVGPGMEEPTPGPEVFADRKVVIYEAKGERELQRVDLQSDGTYRVELAAGTYVVDINRLGIDHGLNLPATVEIKANQITTLDIEIDTGIR